MLKISIASHAVLCASMAVLVACSVEEPPAANTSPLPVPTEPIQYAPPAPPPPPHITKEQAALDSLRAGQTYEDVVRLIGAEGKKRGKVMGNGRVQEMYEWKLEAGTLRGTFLDGTLDEWKPPSPKPVKPSGASGFETFQQALNELNMRVVSQGGAMLFTSPRYAGDGILIVRPTATWLRGTKAEQQSSLNTIGEMWRAAEGSGMLVHVNVENTRNPSAGYLMTWRGN